MRLYILLLLLTLSMACSEPRTDSLQEPHLFDDAVLRNMYDLANTEAWDSLIPYANSTNAGYRLAFAKLMGSTRKPEVLPALHGLLSDAEAYVQLYAGWAVGQLGDTTSQSLLVSAFEAVIEPEVRAEFLQAIGKCSNRSGVDFLSSYNPRDEAEDAGKLWGLYYAGLAGNLTADDLPNILPYLRSEYVESRLAAAHILTRIRIFDLSSSGSEIRDVINREPDPEIRAVMAGMLAWDQTENQTFLIQMAQRDNSPAVRAKALSAFGRDLSEQAKNTMRLALEDEFPWVAMTATDRIADYFALSDTSVYEQILRRTEIPEVRAAILIAYLKNPQTTAKGKQLWAEYFDPTENIFEATVIIKKMASWPAGVDTLKNYLFRNDPLGTSAAETYAVLTKSASGLKSDFIAGAKRAFEEKLLSQSAIFAEAFTDTTLYRSSELPLAEMEAAANYFSGSGQTETREALRKAIAFQTGRTYTAEKPKAKPIDWHLVRSVSSDALATIYTSEGQMELTILIDDAPGSTSNFVALADSKFYDGLPFHRVVPVFVSQGGDPRGDGYGSTDYVIRSEFSPLQFGPGILGYASSGPHTEGCQFFITHVSTPHLNGRYTIFGAMLNGWETLEGIRSGSVIDSVRVKK